MQGWRNAQEDAHSVELELTPNVSLFAVYDGHGGHEVAQWSALALPKLIAEHLVKHNEKLDTFEEKLKELFIQHGNSFILFLRYRIFQIIFKMRKFYQKKLSVNCISWRVVISRRVLQMK